jgi:hypothetical protein
MSQSKQTVSSSVNKTERNVLLMLSYVCLFGMWGVSYWYAMPMSPNVVITATLIVYIGSHRSLRLLATEAEGGVASKDKEVMTSKDAAQFPIVGSCALFGLFCAFKYLDRYWVNIVMGIYFGAVGMISVTSTVAPFIQTWISSETRHGFKKSFPLIGEVDCTFTKAELTAMIPAAIFTTYYLKTKHFMMNNLLGISFCIQSIERISIGSYKIGAILLCGLFVYDIFWVFGSESVFGSNVMVTVAKSFDGPIKLLFPKVLPGGNIAGAIQDSLVHASNSTLLTSLDITPACTQVVSSLVNALKSDVRNTTLPFVQHALTVGRESVAFKTETNCTSIVNKVMQPLRVVAEGEFSLLGLGDIVIPGLFVAILLRFDAVQAGITGLYGEQRVFSKPYFHWNIVFYALGLVVTLYVMHAFKAAQPALLYLVPACLSASLIVALKQGNFSTLLEYNEEQPAENVAIAEEKKEK